MKTKIIAILILISILSVAIFLPVYADEEPTSPLVDQTWVRLGGPLGGIGYDIKMDPSNPDIMYVTDANSGIHKSMDGGQTWFATNTGLETVAGESGDAIPVFSVAIDPNDTNIIWVGMQGQGSVYRSLDGGETWDRKTSGIVEKDGLSIRGISVQPGNSEVVYIAGEISSWRWLGRAKNFRDFDYTKGVVYKSVNGGETWKAVWRGNNLARYVLIHPDDSDILYVSTGIFDRMAADFVSIDGEWGGEGILKSMDGGETWKNINNGLENLYIGSLVMHPEDPETLFAAAGHADLDTGGGIYKTTNGGGTWRQVGGGGRAIAVEISKKDSSIVYAADVGHGLFYFSDDGGETWTTLFRQEGGRGWGPEKIFTGWPIDFEADPRDAKRLFVNNYGGGNFLSEDGGSTWSIASIGYSGANISDLYVDIENFAKVYSIGKSGSFLSMDGGEQWQSLSSDLFESSNISINQKNPDEIIVSYNHDLTTNLSIDDGVSWETVMEYDRDLLREQGFSHAQTLGAVAFAPSDDLIVYGGGSYQHCIESGHDCDQKIIHSLFVSMDGGHNFVPLEGTPFDGTTVTSIIVDQKNADQIWISAAGKGIFYSESGGTDWKTNPLLGDTNIMAFTTDPSDSSIFYAVGKGVVYRSPDQGQSWIKHYAGLFPGEVLSDIVVDPTRPNVLYLAGNQSGVYLSEDFGASWRLHNEGLTMRSVGTLAISADGNTLYAGTRGGGVYRLSIHEQSVFDNQAPIPTPTSLSSPTPTPIVTEVDYKEDFEAPEISDWRLDPPWEIQQVDDNHVLVGSGHHWARLSTREWEDSILRFKINLMDNGSDIHINMRINMDKQNRYMIYLSPFESAVSRQTGPGEFENGLVEGPGLGSGWHTVEIQFIDSQVHVLLDEREVMTFVDEVPLLSGGVAFESLGDGQILIDNVQVFVLAQPTPMPTMTQPPTPSPSHTPTPSAYSPEAEAASEQASSASTRNVYLIVSLGIGLILLVGIWFYAKRSKGS